jgi:hypothetical protein
MVDGEIQIHEGHHLNHTLDLPPVWPEGDAVHKDHGGSSNDAHSHWI